jgi:hypothetical protein
MTRKGADSHCSGDRGKEGMDGSQAQVESSQAGVGGGRAARMDQWIRSGGEGEVLWTRIGKDPRAFPRAMRAASGKAAKAGGRGSRSGRREGSQGTMAAPGAVGKAGGLRMVEA